MTDRFHHIAAPGLARYCQAAAVLVLAAVGGALGGCAGIGDSFASAAFADPAKYDLYDCKLLTAERAGLKARTIEIEKLIAKAENGAGGAVVRELVYGNDYITVKAQSKLAEEAWQRNRCGAAAPVATAEGLPAIR